MEKRVTVIGTVFVDCKGFARESYNPEGRNLGQVAFFHGGVGRNVAENLAKLKIPTSFVSTVDFSALGEEVKERLQTLGIRTDFLQKRENGMGMWLAILNEKGDLAGSISQMPEMAHLQDIIEKNGETILEQSSHVALEVDLNDQIAQNVIALAEKHGVPVFGIPGNLDVILRHPEFLPKLACFICNHIEFARISGKELEGLEIEDMVREVERFGRESGIRSLVVTLGARGAVYAEVGGACGHQPPFPVKVVDTTGAGDAFFSGTTAGLVKGLSLKDAVVIGTKAAGWTIASPQSTCPDLGDKVKELGW